MQRELLNNETISIYQHLNDYVYGVAFRVALFQQSGRSYFLREFR
jgi:hypothetical protein